MTYIPKVGDVVEVWQRESPRHKYNMEMSFVQVLRIIKVVEEDVKLYHVTVKSADSYCGSFGGDGYTGPTTFQTRGFENWGRIFVKLGHLPVKNDGFMSKYAKEFE